MLPLPVQLSLWIDDTINVIIIIFIYICFIIHFSPHKRILNYNMFDKISIQVFYNIVMLFVLFIVNNNYDFHIVKSLRIIFIFLVILKLYGYNYQLLYILYYLYTNTTKIIRFNNITIKCVIIQVKFIAPSTYLNGVQRIHPHLRYFILFFSLNSKNKPLWT